MISGQALVEAAIALPLVVLLVLAVYQTGAIVHTEIALHMAVRQGVRLLAAERDAVIPMQEFLAENEIFDDIKYEISTDQTETSSEVVIKCEVPVMPLFRRIMGETISLEASSVTGFQLSLFGF